MDELVFTMSHRIGKMINFENLVKTFEDFGFGFVELKQTFTMYSNLAKYWKETRVFGPLYSKLRGEGKYAKSRPKMD